MRTPFTLGLALTAPLTFPLPALADSFRCQTAGYCTNDLECVPDSAVLLLETDKTGFATYGWDDSGVARFTAGPAARMDGATVWHLVGTSFAHTLVLADNLQATFSLSSDLGGNLYTSFQALTCVRH